MIAGGLRRVERELGEEALPGRVVRPDLLELLEILSTHLCMIMKALEVRLIPASDQAELSLPLQRAIAETAEQLAQCRPVVACRSRRGKPGQRANLEAALLEMLRHPLGDGRTNAGQELQHPEGSHVIAHVLAPAQDAHHILDVGGLEKLEPAKLYERDVSARELHLESVGVVRG